MKKTDRYRVVLRSLTSWEEYLKTESNLPGPRGNLELVAAVVAEGDARRFDTLRRYTADRAPENTPEAFLCVCGVAGLGKLLADGQWEYLSELRRYAGDPRWRIREAVVMALERLGRADMKRLLAEMEIWSHGTLLERRAAVAGLCQPEILNEQYAPDVTADSEYGDRLAAATKRIAKPIFKTLRKGLGYCWSVAVMIEPEEGKVVFEKWLECADRDIQWIVKQNLRKKTFGTDGCRLGVYSTKKNGNGLKRFFIVIVLMVGEVFLNGIPD